MKSSIRGYKINPLNKSEKVLKNSLTTFWLSRRFVPNLWLDEALFWHSFCLEPSQKTVKLTPFEETILSSQIDETFACAIRSIRCYLHSRATDNKIWVPWISQTKASSVWEESR